jgi:hypothetical protein
MGKAARIRATRGPKLLLPGENERRAERARARRIRQSAPPMIVDPTPPSNEGAKEEPTGPTMAKCQVRGCPNAALERHESPEMTAVWLCGRCGEIARANLLDAAREARIKELITDAYRPAAEHHARLHGPTSDLYAAR